MATIAIVHIGLGGHVAPATRLGSVLARRGHRVIAWGPEAERERIEGSGAELRPYEPAHVDRIMGGLPGFAAMLSEATEQEVEVLIEGLLADRVDLVVHDHHAVWGRVAADFLGLPRIASNPLFPAPGPSGPPEHRAALFPPGWEEAAGRARASRAAIVRKWGIDIGTSYAAPLSDDGQITLSYTTEEIVGDVELVPGWRYVGPLMKPVGRQEQAGPPLVYAAFGTFSTFRPDAYRAVIDALAEEAVQVVISTGRGWVSPAMLGPLPLNTTAHEYVDSPDVLARASVHVTHAGGGSIHESLLAGVPMVCVPQAVDQFLWADRVVALGAGERAELDARAIRVAVRRVLANADAREQAAALGRGLMAFDGERRVNELVYAALSLDASTTP